MIFCYSYAILDCAEQNHKRVLSELQSIGKEEKGTMQKLKTKLDVTQRKITDLYLKESKQAV